MPMVTFRQAQRTPVARMMLCARVIPCRLVSSRTHKQSWEARDRETMELPFLSCASPKMQSDWGDLTSSQGTKWVQLKKQNTSPLGKHDSTKVGKQGLTLYPLSYTSTSNMLTGYSSSKKHTGKRMVHIEPPSSKEGSVVHCRYLIIWVATQPLLGQVVLY